MNDIEKRIKSYEPIFGVYETIPNPVGDGLYSLGEGSFGQVFALRHIRNENHFIALKVIPIPKDKNEENYIRLNSRDAANGMAKSIDAYVYRYAKEIDILKSLDDVPTVVKYKDFDIRSHGNNIGKDLLISMELLTSLDMILMNASDYYNITVNDIINLGIDICDALVNLQKHNIVHRDIKPSNIFVSPKGIFKLGDFGTAKVSMNRETSSERGTPIYAAPEVIKRDKIEAGDTRCDIYSLGIVLYMLMNGNMPPFITKNSRFGEDNEALLRRLNGEPLPLPSRAEEHKKLTQIILKACEYNPRARYENAAQMKAEFEAIRDNHARFLIPQPYNFKSPHATIINSAPFAHGQSNPQIDGMAKPPKPNNKNPKSKNVKNTKKKITIIALSTLAIVGIIIGMVVIGLKIIFNSNTSPEKPPEISNEGDTQNSAEDVITKITTEPMPELTEPEYTPAIDFRWTTDDDGQLTITRYKGTAANINIPPQMSDIPVVKIDNGAFEGCESLIRVIIPDGVTYIGDNAFRDCINLREITIPNSVTYIGDSTFWNCLSLTVITVPNGVESIGNWAFGYCTSLETITIPDSVTNIGFGALIECTSLTAINVYSGNSVYSSDNGILFSKDKNTLIKYPSAKSENSYMLPNNITKIEDRAFDNCISLTAINVDSGNTAFSSENGVLFDKEKTALVRYPNAKNGASYRIPTSVAYINNFAFEDCTKLTRITIPESVAFIGDSAFENCENLKEINIPGNITKIGSYTFFKCVNVEEFIIPANVVYIGNSAFKHCRNLSTITIPASITSLGNSAFADCEKLNKAYFLHSDANTIEQFGENIFNNTASNFQIKTLKNASGFTVPEWKGYAVEADTVSTEADFYWDLKDDKVIITGYKGNETNIVIPPYIDGNPVTVIGESAFKEQREIISIVIPHGVISVDNYAFLDCTSLTEISLPDNVIEIGWAAFGRCTSLTNIVIPDSVVTLRNCAFWKCTGLKTVQLSNKITLIEDRTFEDCESLESIIIPNGVTSVLNGTFKGCTSLKTITIPDSVTLIEKEVFEDCSSLTAINIDGGNNNYISDGGILFNREMTELIKYPSAKSGTTYTVPNSVTHISSRAFFESKNLRTVTIPESVIQIGYNAFEFCSSLTAINVERGNSVYSSVDGVLFGNVSYLNDALIRYPSAKRGTTYTVPNSVTVIRNDVFANCENLTTIIIPASVVSIGENTFRHCTNLQSVFFEGTDPIRTDVTEDSENKYYGFKDIPQNLKVYYRNELIDNFNRDYAGLSNEREFLEQFLKDLKDGNYTNITLARSRNFSIEDILKNKSIENMAIDWEILSGEDNQYKFELTISRGGNEVFPNGKSIWRADVRHGPDGIIEIYKQT